MPRSATDRTPLVGAEGYDAMWDDRERITATSGLHLARIEHLLHRYGSLTVELLERVATSPELGEPLAGAPTYLKAEALHAVTHEDALHRDDILTRRTRISAQTDDRGVAAAQEVAELVAPALGWTAARGADAIEHYRRRVEAERDSQRQPDDHTADAAGLGAPDVRMAVSR